MSYSSSALPPHPAFSRLKKDDLVWCEGGSGNVIAFHMWGSSEASLVAKLAGVSEPRMSTGSILGFGDPEGPELTFSHSEVGNDCICSREVSVPLRLLVINGQEIYRRD